MEVDVRSITPPIVRLFVADSYAFFLLSIHGNLFMLKSTLRVEYPAFSDSLAFFFPCQPLLVEVSLPERDLDF